MASKNRLAYKNTYEKSKDDCKLDDRFQKRIFSQSYLRKIEDNIRPHFFVFFSLYLDLVKSKTFLDKSQ